MMNAKEALENSKIVGEKLQKIQKSPISNTEKLRASQMVLKSPDIPVDTAIEFSGFDRQRAHEVLVDEKKLLSDTDFCDMLDLDYIETDITDEDIRRLRKKTFTEYEQGLIDAIFADLKSGQCEHYNYVLDNYCVDSDDLKFIQDDGDVIEYRRSYRNIEWYHHDVKILRLVIAVYGDILGYKFNDEIAYELGFVDDKDDGDFKSLCECLNEKENVWVLRGSECTR